MKRTAMGLFVGVALATGVVAAQSSSTSQQPPQQQPPQQQQQQPPQQQQKDKPDVTLTGCLSQGSSPTVFILDNAKLNVEDRGEKGKIFVLVAGTEHLS